MSVWALGSLFVISTLTNLSDHMVLFLFPAPVQTYWGPEEDI